MSVGSLLRSSYLLYFSQPAAERTLYRAIQAQPIRSIVELGIDLAGRTPRLLEVAGWRRECLPLSYTGIDLFEARAKNQPGTSLKAAFAQLRLPTVQARLVPGDPAAALERVANSLAGTDLVLIAADQEPDSLARAWPWLPRMLKRDSQVYWEESTPAGHSHWRQVPLAEVMARATQAGRRRRAA